MKAYFGGQIREECRGDLAVVVTRERNERYQDVKVASFLVSHPSEQFTHLTGVGATINPVERVYIGVDHRTGEKIVRQTDAILLAGKKDIEPRLSVVDRLFVYERFLTGKKTVVL